MKTLNYGHQLKLIDVPAVAATKEVETRTLCQYCGGFNSNGGLLPVYVNGLRINPKHEACIEAAKRPMFSMDAFLRFRG